MRLKLIGLACVLASVGCTKSSSVHTSELTRFNGRYAVQEGVAASPGTTVPGGIATTTHTPYSVTRVTVRRPDGRTMEIVGDFGIQIDFTQNGFSGTHHFDHPVIVEAQDGSYTISGSNAGGVTIGSEAIDEVRVSQHDGPATTVLSAVLGIGIGAILAVIIVSSI